MRDDLYGCAECGRYYRGGHNEPGVLEHVLEHRIRMVRGLREVWATGDVNRFYRCAKRATSLMGLNHGTTDEMWARAMGLVYRDRPDYHLARITQEMPALIDTIECDSLLWARDRGLLDLAADLGANVPEWMERRAA